MTASTHHSSLITFMQSYILDGTRYRVARDPHTGVCCEYRGPAGQPPEEDALVQRWNTAPDPNSQSTEERKQSTEKQTAATPDFGLQTPDSPETAGKDFRTVSGFFEDFSLKKTLNKVTSQDNSTNTPVYGNNDRGDGKTQTQNAPQTGQASLF
jgi:hypothetical protein